MRVGKGEIESSWKLQSSRFYLIEAKQVPPLVPDVGQQINNFHFNVSFLRVASTGELYPRCLSYLIR